VLTGIGQCWVDCSHAVFIVTEQERKLEHRNV